MLASSHLFITAKVCLDQGIKVQCGCCAEIMAPLTHRTYGMYRLFTFSYGLLISYDCLPYWGLGTRSVRAPIHRKSNIAAPVQLCNHQGYASNNIEQYSHNMLRVSVIAYSMAWMWCQSIQSILHAWKNSHLRYAIACWLVTLSQLYYLLLANCLLTLLLLNVYAMPNCSKHTACSMLQKIVIMGTQLLLTPKKLLPKLLPALLLVTCTLMAKTWWRNHKRLHTIQDLTLCQRG